MLTVSKGLTNFVPVWLSGRMYRAMKIILCSALVLAAVVMPVGNAGPAMAEGPHLILFWDGDTIPSGWTCISASAGDPFYNRFPRGADTYGGQGGSATHSHSAGSISTGMAIPPFPASPRWGDDVPLFTHHHDISHSSMSAESNYPEYRSLKVISYNAGIPAGLPAGTIALFSGAPPAGWERYAAQDGRMVLGKATVGTGGSNQHRHSNVNIVLTSAKGDNKVSGMLYPNFPVATMSHDHSIDDISYLSWEQNVPPYASVIMAKANADTATIPVGMLGLFAGPPPAAWNIQSNPQGHFYQRFLQGSSTYGEVGGASSHTHQDSSGQTKLNTPIPKTVCVVPVYLFSMVTHRHSYTVKWTQANNIPPYTDVIIAAYEPGIPSLETEDPSLVMESSATLNGDITDIGDTSIIVRGFEWDADGVTPFTYSWTENGTFGLGSFSHPVASLARGTLYYYRSKAKNEVSTWGYGSVASFLTKPATPTGLAITAGDEQLSLTWTKGEAAARTMVRSSTITYPATIADGTQVYFDTGSNTVNIGLTNGTPYYYSAWSEVTAGALQQFSSDKATATGMPFNAPDVTTDTATAITGTTAVLNASITNIFGMNIVERGFDWDTNSGETYAYSWTENGTFQTGSYTHTLTGLTKGQIYYFRGKARHNGTVWGYGQELHFITRPDPPSTFSATAAIGQVNLSWSKGEGAFCTYIERSTTGYPANPGDGTPIYSGTDSSFSDSIEIRPQTHYYYSAWSVAEGGGEMQFSTDKAESSAFVTAAPSVTTITIVALFLLLSMAAARQLLSAKGHQKR